MLQQFLQGFLYDNVSNDTSASKRTTVKKTDVSFVLAMRSRVKGVKLERS